MKNIQVTIDPETLAGVDRLGKTLGLTRSEIVRQALRGWLRRHAVEGLEREWLAALDQKPADARRADDWKAVRAWSKQ